MTVSWKQHSVAAFVAVFVVAPLAWMLADRGPPYERQWGEINPEHPHPGDFVQIKWHFKVTRYCPPYKHRNITRTVIDSSGKIHDYDAVEGVFGATRDTTPEVLTRGFALPKDIRTGPARYISVACFACNPTQYFWPVCVRTPEVHFNIEPKPNE